MWFNLLALGVGLQTEHHELFFRLEVWREKLRCFGLAAGAKQCPDPCDLHPGVDAAQRADSQPLFVVAIAVWKGACQVLVKVVRLPLAWRSLPV